MDIMWERNAVDMNSKEKKAKSANTSIDAIEVYYDGFGEHRLVGYVTLQNNRPVFGYDASWLASGYELSPIEMPLKSGCIKANTIHII